MNICNKCGNQTDENARFCTLCGAEQVSSNPFKQNQNGRDPQTLGTVNIDISSSQPMYQNTMNTVTSNQLPQTFSIPLIQEANRKQKSKKALPIAIISIIIVLSTFGIVIFTPLALGLRNTVKITFSSPMKYFQSVENQNRKGKVDNVEYGDDSIWAQTAYSIANTANIQIPEFNEDDAYNEYDLEDYAYFNDVIGLLLEPIQKILKDYENYFYHNNNDYNNNNWNDYGENDEIYGAIEDGAIITVWETKGVSAEFMQEAARLFSQKYGVEVLYEEVEYNEVADRLIFDGPAGVGADVYVTSHANLGVIYDNGLALENDLSGYADKFMEASIKGGKGKDNKLYGYPLAAESYALFYNKDLMLTPPTTWDEIIAFAENFNDAANNKFACMWEPGNAYFGFAFLSPAGPLFGESGTDMSKILTNTPEAVAAMKYYQSLRSKVFDVPSLDITYNTMMSAFIEGKTAMMLNGPWALYEIQSTGINFGIVPFPKLEDGANPLTFAGFRQLFVSSYTNYPNAAKAFTYFCSVDLAKLRVEMTGDVPVLKDIQINDEHRLAFQAAVEYAFPMPSLPTMHAYWTVMGGTYSRIWDGNEVESELKLATKYLLDQIDYYMQH